MSYCVYKHTLPNGKVYIGITKVNPLARWCNGHGYRENKRFFNDIVRFGWNNVKHEILFTGLSEAEARMTEARLIAQCKSYKSKHGYNQVKGLSYGFITDIELRRDPRNNMSREEYRMYCKSEEYYRQHDYNNQKRIPVIQCDMNGNVIARFPSIKRAHKETGIDAKGIRDCVSGKYRQAGGYVWRQDMPPGTSSDVRHG